MYTEKESEAFCALCQGAHECWTTYANLFDELPDCLEQRGVKIQDFMDTPYGQCLHRLNKIVIHHILLEIAKLHDPACQAGNENLSINFFVKQEFWTEEEETRIKKLASELDGLYQKIKPARNQILAHNDREAVVKNSRLGEFQKGEDERYFQALGEFCSMVWCKVSNRTGPFLSPTFEFTKSGISRDYLCPANEARETRKLIVNAFLNSEDYMRMVDDDNLNPTYYGVDGCRSGWFWVGLEPGGTVRHGIAEKLIELVDQARDTDRIFVDIPIGLQTEPRVCDLLARKFIGKPRASSVFPTPAREVLDYSCYAEASERNHEVTGKRLTMQTFSIMPRIKEVDDLLHVNGKARRIVREIHPEVCFRGIAGQAMAFSKKKLEGYQERIVALVDMRPGVAREVADMVARYQGSGVARDDVVDAMAAAITAAVHPSALCSLPKSLERDSRGLPMEMIYADVSLTSRV